MRGGAGTPRWPGSPLSSAPTRAASGNRHGASGPTPSARGDRGRPGAQVTGHDSATTERMCPPPQPRPVRRIMHVRRVHEGGDGDPLPSPPSAVRKWQSPCGEESLRERVQRHPPAEDDIGLLMVRERATRPRLHAGHRGGTLQHAVQPRSVVSAVTWLRAQPAQRAPVPASGHWPPGSPCPTVRSPRREAGREDGSQDTAWAGARRS